MVAAGFVLSFAVVLPVLAQTSPAGRNGFPGGGEVRFGGGMHNASGTIPGVFGSVTAVNGTTLTVTSKARINATSTPATVYTVDASGAQVLKNGTSSSVSSIATGDMVMVQGTVSGTNVAATVIRDGMGGMMGKRGFGPGGRPTGTMQMPPSPIQGNGEPVVGGSITAINGSTLTVTNKSNVTYTIDASSATIIKNGTSTAITNMATGDNVVVQGTVNGTSVTASSVIDQGSSTTAAGAPSSKPSFGFFGMIGSFFKHLFGF